jgi:hypothetical protein
MSVWAVVLISSSAAFALKYSGYLIPQRVLEAPVAARLANLLTVALLSGLVAVQTLANGQSIQLDARIPAVLVAIGLFSLRVPFIVVVLAAGIVAALLRNFGIMS